MNVKPVRTCASCMCFLSLTVLCLGCRVAHDLFSPIHRSSIVDQRQEKPSSPAEGIRNSEAAMRPTASNTKVAETEGISEKDTLAQSSSNAWSAADFETPQVATEPSLSVSMPPEATMPNAKVAQEAMPQTAAPELRISALSAVAILDAQAPDQLTPTQTFANPRMKAPETSTQANLELHIENVRPKRGKLKVAVFTDAENFLNPSFVSQTFELKDDASTASTSLSIDKPCAIAVFQDLDGDGQLTKNPLGIPVEPCAFSNNAVIKRGPPKFSDAMVQPAQATAPPTRASIRLP